MSDTTHSFPDPGLQCLGAGVFGYLARKSRPALMNLVQSLADLGDLASLGNALASGAIWAGDEGQALFATRAAVKRYATAMGDASVTEHERSATRELCVQWIATGQASGYPQLARSVVTSLMRDNIGHDDFLLMMRLLGQPRFGIDLNEIVPAKPELNWHLPIEERPGESLLGQFVDKGLVSLALDLVGSDLAEFPVTERTAQSVNLAMQAVFASRPKPEVLEKLVSMLAPGATAGWLQLGDIVTAYMGAALKGSNLPSLLQEPAMAHHMSAYTQGEKESLPWAIGLLGAGAQLRHPDFVWECARTIKLHVRHDDEKGRTLEEGTLPLPHAAIFFHPRDVAKPIVAQALSRMIMEGGMDVDAKDNGDRTLLQAAASIGHQEAVEVLLGLGADTRYFQNTWTPATAAETAKQAGHHDVAAMILAHDARMAIERARHGTHRRCTAVGESV